MKEFSVFDIIGPRMVGPSSSHTAGAVRIGLVAHRIARGKINSAEITLYGSFAQTGRGHGTDRAVIAGILGVEPDDARVKHSMLLAKSESVDIKLTTVRRKRIIRTLQGFILLQKPGANSRWLASASAVGTLKSLK